MKYCWVYRNVKRITGNIHDIVVADAVVNGNVISLTYNFKNDNVVISEWYKVENLLEDITAEFKRFVKDYFH